MQNPALHKARIFINFDLNLERENFNQLHCPPRVSKQSQLERDKRNWANEDMILFLE